MRSNLLHLIASLNTGGPETYMVGLPDDATGGVQAMKIMLVITDLELGGAQKHVLEIARRLPRERHVAGLATSYRGVLLDEARGIEGLRVHVIPALVRPIGPWSDLVALIQLWRLFRRERPDVVHTHLSKAGILGRWAAKLAGVPRVVHTVHGWGFGAAPSRAMAKIFIWVERLTARITDRLVAVSDGTKTEGLSLGIGLSDSYEVIHYTISRKEASGSEGFEIGAMIEKLDRLYTGLPCRARDGRERATAVISALKSGFREGGPGAICAIPALLHEMVLAPLVMFRAGRGLGRLRGAGGRPDWARLRGDDQLEVLYIWTETWRGAEASGGVMTHTAGVLAGLGRKGVKTTALCPGTALERHVDMAITVEPRRQASHLPEVMEAEYNERVEAASLSFPAGVSPAFVYHRHSRNHFAAALVARSLGVPFVLEYNGSITWEAKHWGRRLWFPWFTSKVAGLVLGAAQLVTVVSDQLRDELVARGISSDRILVNPNGVDADVFEPGVGGEGVREKYGLESLIVIGHTGTFRRRHGVATLVDAFARIHEERADLHLLLVGGGPAVPEIQSRIKQRGLKDAVTLTGMVPHGEVPACLAACDILVCPQGPGPEGTVFHGSPTKLFEYMAMAKAVVASGVGQIGQVLADGENGRLVEPGSAKRLAHALVELVDDAGLRQRLGSKARETVMARYTWDHHVERLMSKLHELAERNDPGAAG